MNALARELLTICPVKATYRARPDWLAPGQAELNTDLRARRERSKAYSEVQR